MMYTLDLSGHDASGKAGINRFGGLFFSIEAAAIVGHSDRARSRLPFVPEVLWVRDEEGNVALRTNLGEQDAS